MPALLNPRHERFARELASGKTASDAYEIAGFKRNDGNASTLKGKQSISKRVAELQAEQAETARKATELAAERLSIDREWVLARLVENAMQARAESDFGPSNQALNLIGKELGMFVERVQSENTTYVVSGEPIDDPEAWAAEHAPAH